ncbi:MAG TPA: hypothetical protein PKY01_07880 [Candidatus Hydrogenedentes bacterium]|nr:hypothetical protein [Candidatus Hydrogenedentota bacterium]HQM47431.1 hypothetical protein [Candidatus Hydrogenedentota bacterium]
MFLEATIASLVLAAVVIGWVLIQRWAATTTYPEECNIPRSECPHCISRDSCTLHANDDVADEHKDGSRQEP